MWALQFKFKNPKSNQPLRQSLSDQGKVYLTKAKSNSQGHKQLSVKKLFLFCKLNYNNKST
jgi:hypothetical protein